MDSDAVWRESEHKGSIYRIRRHMGADAYCRDIFPSGGIVGHASTSRLDFPRHCIPVAFCVVFFPTVTGGSELEARVEQQVVSCVHT